MGHLHLVGEKVTPWGLVAGAGTVVGDTVVKLLAPVEGWRVGDKVVLPGLSRSPANDDEGTIQAISADKLQVTLAAPLKFIHPTLVVVGKPSRPMPLANLSRRVTLKSEVTTPVTARGHMMIMHACEVANIACVGMGRQDKKVRVTDLPDLTNLRGRYPFHIHVLGINQGVDHPFTASGCVVEDSPNWGFVNHTSMVTVEDCIVYKAVGACYVAETGDEIGTFRKSLAIRSMGNGQIPSPAEDRQDHADFAFSGIGFWAQGGGILMEDNLSFGAFHMGYVYMGENFKLPSSAIATVFPLVNMPDPYKNWQPYSYSVKPYVAPQQVPPTCRRNVSAGSAVGLVLWGMGGNNMPRTYVPGPGTFDDNYFEGSENAILLGYPGYQNFVKNTLRAPTTPTPSKWDKTGIGNTGVTTEMIFDGNDIGGYHVAILGPTSGNSKVINNTFQALCGLFVRNTYQITGRTIEISNNTMVAPPPAALTIASTPGYTYGPLPFLRHQKKQVKSVTAAYDYGIASVHMPAYTASGTAFFVWVHAFETPSESDHPKDVMKVGTRRLYMYEEDPLTSTDPFKACPPEMRLKADGTPRTTGDLVKDLGLYMGGCVLPTALVRDTNIAGVMSDGARTFVPTMTVNKNGYFYQVAAVTTGFMLKVKDKAGVFKEFGPYTLIAGKWNFPDHRDDRRIPSRGAGVLRSLGGEAAQLVVVSPRFKKERIRCPSM